MNLAERWDTLTTWLGPWFWYLAAASAFMVIAGALLLPVLIVRMPADYFLRPEPPTVWSRRHPAARLALRVGRNLLGAVLLFAGLVMIFTPGQGLLSILAGVSLLDLPRKRQLERRIVKTPLVLRTLNAIRRRANKPPLLPPASV